MTVPKKSAATRFDDLPGGLPNAVIPEDVDLALVASEAVVKLSNLKQQDLDEDALWRDYFSLTGHFRTLHSSQSIAKAWEELKQIRQPSNFEPTQDTPTIARHGLSTSWIDVRFTFAVRGELPGAAAGYVSLIPDRQSKGQWKIWMLRTWLENFDGHGHPDELQPVQPAQHLTDPPTNGAASDHVRFAGDSEDYGAVIIGAGQAGLSLAGRLKALSVPYVIFERNSQVGENWTSRYDSLRWHTSKEYGNLPFDRTYLPEDDYQLTTKMIGSGFKRWADRFGINVRCGTSVENASFDDKEGIWTVKARSEDKQYQITTKTLVLATGGYAGVPVSPNWPGRERYEGTAMHSVDYRSAKPWSRKRGIVVGTANTGHDVAEDMVQADFESVTMVQRGQTFVFPAEWLHASEDMTYHLDMPTSEADRMTFTYPYKVMREFTNRKVHELVVASSDRFDALERVGFKLEREGDIYTNLYTRFGGHYVDIGTSDRIAKGQIKMKSDSAVKEWTREGLLFEDGSELKADVIVLCTGFDHDFRKMSASIVGQEAADAMEDFFGLDTEGEIRGAYKVG